MRFSKLLVALPFAVTLSACGGEPAASPNLRLIDNARQSGRPTVAEFGSEFCTSCRQMKVILDVVAKRTQGRAHVLVFDIMKDSSLQQAWRIQMIPTQVFFDAQGKEVWRHMGPLSEAQVMDRLGLKP